MNKVVLVGRLTAKPELRYTPQNTAFTRFSVAVNRSFTNADGKREADFINVPLAYVEGSNVVIEKLVSGQWDDQFVIVESGTVIEGRMFLEI